MNVFEICLFLTFGVGFAKITVKKLEPCDKTANYKMQWSFTLKDIGEKQLVESGYMKTEVDLGKDVIIKSEVNVTISDQNKGMLTIEENYCEALQKYMGDFEIALMKAAGIDVKTCPIPKGEYTVKDFALDFTKFKYKTLPDANIQINSTLIDSKTQEILNCMIIEIESKDT